MESQFVTGKGSSDTRALKIRDKITGELKDNPHFKRGEDYETTTFSKILEMVPKPTRKSKSKADWAIFSTYRKHDARDFSVQAERGEYVILPVDLDIDVPHIEDVKDKIKTALGDVTYVIYSSRGAKPHQPKFRILFPLAKPVSGSNYTETQAALFDLLEDAGLTCDRTLERTGQIIFLPNKGEHYEFHINA